MLSKFSFAARLLCIPLFLTVSIGNAKTVEVAVVSDKGVPIPSAKVSLHRVNGPAGPPLTASSGTDRKGVIEASDEVGWKVCASAVLQKYFDTCIWENEVPQDVRVAPGTAKVSPTVTLRTGAMLRFQVSDPESVLGSTPDAGLEIGVITDQGRYYQAGASFDKESRSIDYEILVPSGLNLRLSIASFGLSVTDESGVPLSRDNPETFISGQAEGSITLRKLLVRRNAN